MEQPLPPLAPEDHSCPACGIDYGATGRAAAIGAIGGLPPRYRALVEAVPLELLRARPGDGIWCPLEYLCHVRDVFVTATIRLYRCQKEDTPAVEPMYNDLRAARFAYQHRQPDDVVAELGDNVAGFLAQVRRVPDDGWVRCLQRQPGEIRTARWLLLQAMHEGEHHLRDVSLILTA